MKQIVIMFVLVLLPIMASADAKGTCGKNVSYSYDSSTGNLTISGTGAMDDYKWRNEAPWYNYREEIVNAIIEDGVTSIGNQAFYSCSGLTSITIPNSVASIGDEAFCYCSGLTSVTIPNSVTRIGWAVFKGSGWYKNQSSGLLYLDKWLLGYKDVGPTGALNISEGTKGIAAEAFFGYSDLTSVSIPNSVTIIGDHAFWGCSGLTSITIPNSVTSLGECVFRDCSNLVSVMIGNSLTSIGNQAFYSCSGLTSITIGNSVTSIGNSAFYGCNNLTSITIPNSVTKIESNAFRDCIGLTSVKFGNSVTSIVDYAFCGCSGLTSITFPNSLTNIGNGVFAGCSGLTSISIPKSVTNIGYLAFSECSSLTDVYCLAENVPYTNSYAFNSSNISNATLHVPAASQGKYSNAAPWKDFKEIVAFKKGDVNGDNKVDAADIEEMVNYILGNPSEKFIFIAADMNDDDEVNAADVVLIIKLCTFNAIETPLTFEAVSGTVTVSVNNYYASQTPTIQYRVDDGEWTDLELWHNDHHGSPYYANAIPAGKIVQIRSELWYPCFIPQIDGFDISCDADCYVYGNVSSVNSLDYATNVSGVPLCLFYQNTHIKNHPEKALFFGNYCGSYAFYGCTGLTSITIPNNVTSIGEKAFGNCTKLTDVTCLAESVPSTNTSAFDGSSIGSATLHVPQSALSDYQNTAPWSGFGKIVAIGGKE